MDSRLARILFLLCLGSHAVAAQEPATTPAAEPPRGLKVHAAGAFEGYTLFAPLRSENIFLIDMNGDVVHRWKHGFPPLSNYLLDNGHVVCGSRNDDNPVFFGGGLAGRVRELDWDGNVVWEYQLSNTQRVLHHDIEPMPNGHWLAIAWEYLSPEQTLALGRDPKVVDSHGWWPDAVLELEPTPPSGAKTVWEWRAQDHLIQDADRAKPNFGAIAEHPERLDINGDHRDKPALTPDQIRAEKEREKELRKLGYAGGNAGDGDAKDASAAKDEPPPKPGQTSDWMHTNSVDFDAANDLILLSSPHMNEIYVIDHSTTTEEARGTRGGKRGHGGDLLYRWGHPRNWGGGTDADRKLFGQHQPEWIAAGLPGAGHVLLFNNEHPSPKGTEGQEFSSVDELVLPFDPKLGFMREAGKPFGPSAPVWSYTAPKPHDFHSFFISGAQRLPNGNTLICAGQSGRFFEVKPGGQIVWEYWNPYGGELESTIGKANPNKERVSPVQTTSVFRATRIAPTHPALLGRKLAPIEKQ
jgi:hypothetical protein